MGRLISRFRDDDSGATAIEYWVIAAGISIGISTAVNGSGTTLNTGLRPPLALSCIAVERPHHPDPRKHQPAAAVLRGIDQVLDRNLPALLPLHVFRQLHDVIGGVLQRGEPAAAAQAYRLIERRRPRHLRSGVVLIVKLRGTCLESSRAAARACALSC